MKYIKQVKRAVGLLILLIAGWVDLPIFAQTIEVELIPDPSVNLTGTDNGTAIQPLESWEIPEYGISFNFSKGTGSTNPAYYRNGSNIRLYSGNTFNLQSSSSYAVESVIFYTSAYRSPEGTLSSDCGQVMYDGDSRNFYWDNTVNSSEVNFSISGSQFRFTGIKVTLIPNQEAKQKPKAPVFSQNSCNFYKAFELTITDINDSPVTIRYTLDGSDPSEENGLIYTAPVTIPVGESVTLKAACINENGISSITKATYTFISKHLLSLELPNKNGISNIYYSSDSEYGEWYSDNSAYITDGEKVYLSFNVNTGYKCKSITINGQPQSSSSYGLNFVMPSEDVRIIIEAEFDPTSPSDPQPPTTSTKKYSLSLVSNPIGASSLNGSGTYTEGESVYVYATGYSGYVFTGWTKDGETISNYSSFTFTMPSTDVILTANYIYKPSDPSEPQQPTLKHPLTVISSPAGAGTFSTSGSECTYGQEYYVYAYPKSGYRFKGWIVNGEAQETTSTTYRSIMTDAGAQVVGLFVFDPGPPSSPKTNYFDPETGKVIIDDFTPGNLFNVLQLLVGESNLSKVTNITVKGQTNSNDYGFFNNLENASVIDLSRTYGVTTLKNYAFQGSNAVSITLPEAITEMGNYVFYDCNYLTALTIYATIPPTCSSGTFAMFANKNNCTVYVPESSVELYQQALYWKDFNIKPIDHNIQIGLVTPLDIEGWNDLSRMHQINIEGEYSGVGQSGRIEYCVEESGEWVTMTGFLDPGSKFTKTLNVNFIPGRAMHTIHLRMVDAMGKVTSGDSIVYTDINFVDFNRIENKTYNWGEALTQGAICDELESNQYNVSNYLNNINAGTASFDVCGIYPYTIGKKTLTFTIDPLPLSGEVMLDNADPIVYDGNTHQPEWHFTESCLDKLQSGTDYKIVWKNNVLPGQASLYVEGINNFSGSLSTSFNILKAELDPGIYEIYIPSEDIIFDNKTHGATCSKESGVGNIKFYYATSEQTDITTQAPCLPGNYDVYIEIEEGSLFYGQELTYAGSFTIYQFDEKDWATLQSLIPRLTACGWHQPWDITDGISSVSSLPGLSIEKGKVVGLDLSGALLTGQFPIELLAFKNLSKLTLSNNNFEGALETIVAYMQQNPGVGTALTELNIANNSLSGNLGVMATCFPNLTSLYASGNHLSDIYPMISEKVVNLDVSAQTIDRTIEYNLSNTSNENLAQQIPTILLYDHPTQSYTKPLNLQYSMADGFGMTLSFINGHITISNISDQNTYHGESGDVIDVIALDSDPSKANSSLKLKLIFEAGDANFINGLDITDLQSTILYVFNDYPSYLPFNFTAADTYPDRFINVQDVVATVNLLLNIPMTKLSCRRVALNSVYTDEDTDNQIWIENGHIVIKNEVPIAAMSIDMDSPSDFDLAKYGMSSVSNGTRTIAYSIIGGQIPKGINEIGTCQSDAKILNISLSTETAQSIDIDIRREFSSSIDETVLNKNNTYEIYTPEGVRIPVLRKGINIIKYPDNKISKIYVR